MRKLNLRKLTEKIQVPPEEIQVAPEEIQDSLCERFESSYINGEIQYPNIEPTIRRVEVKNGFITKAYINGVKIPNISWDELKEFQDMKRGFIEIFDNSNNLTIQLWASDYEQKFNISIFKRMEVEYTDSFNFKSLSKKLDDEITQNKVIRNEYHNNEVLENFRKSLSKPLEVEPLH